MRTLLLTVVCALLTSGCWVAWEIADISATSSGGAASGTSSSATSSSGTGGSSSSSTTSSVSGASGASGASSSASSSSSSGSTSSASSSTSSTGGADAGCGDSFDGPNVGSTMAQFPYIFFFPYIPSHSFVGLEVDGIFCSSTFECIVDVYLDGGGAPSAKLGSAQFATGQNHAKFQQHIDFNGGQTYWFAMYLNDPAPYFVRIGTLAGAPVNTYMTSTFPVSSAPQQGGPFAFSVLCAP